MFTSSLSRSLAVVCLSAASALVWAQDPGGPLPVTRLAGQSAAQDQAPQRPGTLRGLPVTSLDERSHRADLDAQQRLTVSFARPTAIQDVLFLLTRGTAFSVAMDPSIKGTFVGELREVTLRQAIGSVLAPTALAYDVDGTVIRVFPQRAQTRIFDLDLLNVERSWQRALSGDSATMLTARVPVSDPLDEVTAGIATMLSETGRVHVDRRAGLAHVTDYPDRLDRVALYLEALQARGSRQVRLRARVLDVTLTSAPAVDWSAVRARLGLPDASLAAGCIVDPAALQAALAAQGDVRVVSAPEFVAINNEPAVVRATTPGSSALALTVVPQISEDGVVQLSLSPSWTRPIESPARPDAMSIVEADTVLRVMDGATAMITGLLRSDDPEETESTGAVTHARGRSHEVVVLVTPTVVNAGARVAAR